MEKLKQEFLDHLTVFSEKVMDFIPDFLVMLVILAAGFVAGYIVMFLLTKIFKAIKFDVWSDEVGLSSIFVTMGIKTPPARVVILFAYWLIIVSFFMAGFASLGVAITREFTMVFFLYLPKLLSALAIFIVGFLMAGFLGRAALLAAVNSGIRHSRLIGQTVRAAVLLLVFAMGLEQLAIAPNVVLAGFAIIFGAVAMAAAIAFGLGGRDAAGKVIEDLRRNKEEGRARDIDQI